MLCVSLGKQCLLEEHADAAALPQRKKDESRGWQKTLHINTSCCESLGAKEKTQVGRVSLSLSLQHWQKAGCTAELWKLDGFSRCGMTHG